MRAEEIFRANAGVGLYPGIMKTFEQLLGPDLLSQAIGNEWILKALTYSRIGVFSLESIPIIFARKTMGALEKTASPPQLHIEALNEEIKQLVQQDMQNIDQGIYPVELLLPEAPHTHLKRYARVLWDSVLSNVRIRKRQHKSFRKNTLRHLKNLPDYYQRNFHYQTDGYLSKSSAEIYDHQTEILFKGTIGTMRRVLLAPLIEWINVQSGTVKILEIASGTGEGSEILLESCPNISLTCLDLSGPYLELAKEKLARFSNVEFVQGAAEELNRENKFDGVLSIYLFHELPLEIRKKIMNVTVKALKSGGRFCHIDSLQLGDSEKFDWALKRFPLDFHEPFFKNYTQVPLSEIMNEFVDDKIKITAEQTALLSKSIAGIKI